MAWKIFIRILSIGRHERILILGMMGSGILIALAQLLEPVLFGRVIDALARTSDFERLVFWWVGLCLVNGSLSIFLSIVSDRYAHRQRTRVLERSFERTIHLPYQEHILGGSGKLIRTVQTGSDQVFWIVLSFFREQIIAISNILILIPLAFYLEFYLAMVLFGLSSVYAMGNWFIVRKTFSGQKSIESHHQRIMARLIDVMGQVAVIRSFNRFADEIAKFKALITSLLGAQYPVLYWWGVLNVMTRLMAMGTMVVIVALGAKWVQMGKMSQGQIVTFVGFSTLLIARLEQVSHYFNNIVSQLSTAQNLFQLFDQKNPEENLVQTFPKAPIRGHVAFQRVSFQYGTRTENPGVNGVFDLNFVAKPGQKIALVGPTGAGKTTCLSLLQRLYVPDQGSILIDHKDIRTLSVASLSSVIATVFQEPGLFNRSIRENLLMGRSDATMDEVVASAQMAQIHDFIMSRPGGYDFVIGERGLALSGGERQRLAIARAFLKNAPILILDEATSALDNRTEAKVQAAMQRLCEGRTTFLIAHRLSTIVSADLILVMQEGRIVQMGTYRELSQKQGLFSSLLYAGDMEREGFAKSVDSHSPEALLEKLL
jgi:glucan exporter ATP-binding protein